jgi:hypothetical protein
MKAKNISLSNDALIFSISTMPLTNLLLILAILRTLTSLVIFISFCDFPILAIRAILLILAALAPSLAEDIINRSKGIRETKSIKNQPDRYLQAMV